MVSRIEEDEICCGILQQPDVPDAWLAPRWGAVNLSWHHFYVVTRIEEDVGCCGILKQPGGAKEESRCDRGWPQAGLAGQENSSDEGFSQIEVNFSGIILMVYPGLWRKKNAAGYAKQPGVTDVKLASCVLLL